MNTTPAAIALPAPESLTPRFLHRLLSLTRLQVSMEHRLHQRAVADVADDEAANLRADAEVARDLQRIVAASRR
jgi:hypothetical protein